MLLLHVMHNCVDKVSVCVHMSKLRAHNDNQSHVFWIPVQTYLGFFNTFDLQALFKLWTLLLKIHTCFYVFKACSFSWPCSDCILCSQPLSAPQRRVKICYNSVYSWCGLISCWVFSLLPYAVYINLFLSLWNRSGSIRVLCS